MCGLDIDHRIENRLTGVGGAGKSAGDDLEETRCAKRAIIGVRIHGRLTHGHVDRARSVRRAKDLIDHIGV